MALEMQEEQYLAFYKDSMLGYSKAYQKYAIRQLKQDGWPMLYILNTLNS